MSASVERAKELFLQGYSCSQAVVGAFCDQVGMDFETAMRLAAPFGGGVGRMRQVCGAVSGAFILAGLKYGYTDPNGREEKAAHYKLIQDMAAAFTAEKGSIICKDLLQLQQTQKQTHIPDERTAQYYKERPCVYMVEQAAIIAEKVLNGSFNVE